MTSQSLRWQVSAQRAFPVTLVLTLLLAGCALQEGHVNLSYAPIRPPFPVDRPNLPPVAVTVIDERSTQVVGEKINQFGMMVADIVSDTNVPDLLKTAFGDDLKQFGFPEGGNGNTVFVRLGYLHNQFTIGIFHWESTATIGMEVSVKRADGSIAYRRYVIGESKEWIFVAGEKNAQRMLDAAIQRGVAKVFNDSAFINAVSKR